LKSEKKMGKKFGDSGKMCNFAAGTKFDKEDETDNERICLVVALETRLVARH
jgi:hypothetical protein